MAPGTIPRDDEPHHNAPGYPQAMPSMPLGFSSEANVPNLPGQGPSGGVYFTGTPRGGVIYPSTWNGVDPGPGPEPLFSAEEDDGSYDSSDSSHTDTRERISGTVDVATAPEVSSNYEDAYLQLLAFFLVQLAIGYDASSGPPPIPRRTRPTAYRPYPVQPASGAHLSDVPHQQDPVAVIATNSQPPSMSQSPRPSAYQLYPVQLAYVAARSPHPSDVHHQRSPVAAIATSSQSPHMPQSPRPTAYQPYPVQLAYVAARSPYPSDVPHQRNPVAVIATGSQSPHMLQSPRPTTYQPYPVQRGYGARSPHPSDVPHQQDLVAVTATSSQSLHMPQSPRPTAYQPHPVQPVYVARPPHPSDVPHQQNPVAVTATSSQYQGSAFVQDALGRPYYQQWTSNYTVFSSPASTALQLPVQPQRFNLTEEHDLPPQMPDARPYFADRGRRRALIIGINYIFHSDTRFRLRYCVEDAYAVANFLRDNLGFARENIRIMTDECSPWYPPTKENILRAMRALVRDAQPHDSFFIYFSGHAVQIKDLDGDESDGLDECICAMDYLGDDPHPNPNTRGLIVDDIMHDIMVRPLPAGCRLTAIFDSCNSGTLLDLPYLYNARGVVKEFRHPKRLKILRQKSSYADVISLGATKDGRAALETNRGGALRRAFIECLTAFDNDLTYRELIQYLREDMISRGIPQRPLLSSSHEIDTNLPFII